MSLVRAPRRGYEWSRLCIERREGTSGVKFHVSFQLYEALRVPHHCVGTSTTGMELLGRDMVAWRIINYRNNGIVVYFSKQPWKFFLLKTSSSLFSPLFRPVLPYPPARFSLFFACSLMLVSFHSPLLSNLFPFRTRYLLSFSLLFVLNKVLERWSGCEREIFSYFSLIARCAKLFLSRFFITWWWRVCGSWRVSWASGLDGVMRNCEKIHCAIKPQKSAIGCLCSF